MALKLRSCTLGTLQLQTSRRQFLDLSPRQAKYFYLCQAGFRSSSSQESESKLFLTHSPLGTYLFGVWKNKPGKCSEDLFYLLLALHRLMCDFINLEPIIYVLVFFHHFYYFAVSPQSNRCDLIRLQQDLSKKLFHIFGLLVAAGHNGFTILQTIFATKCPKCYCPFSR